MEDKIFSELDAKIYAFDKKFDILKHILPQNLTEENKKFLEKYNNGIKYNPIYVYNEIDIESLEEYNKYFQNVTIPDSLIGKIYKEYVSYIIDKIKFIRGIGNSYLVTENSIKLYGRPNKDLVNSAKEVLERGQLSKTSSNKFYNASVLKEAFVKRLLENNIENYEVLLTDKIVSKVNIDYVNQKVYINENVLFSEADIKRLVVHEIDTHVKRVENGRKQKYKIFTYGFPKSLETEEGLAIFNEVKENVVDEEMYRVYAARIVAVDMAINSSFYDIFEYLLKYIDQNEALIIVSEVKRGISNTLEKGAFVKEAIYFSGYNRIKNELKNSDLSVLYCGLIGIDDITNIKKLESQEEVIIEKINRM